MNRHPAPLQRLRSRREHRARQGAAAGFTVLVLAALPWLGCGSKPAPGETFSLQSSVAKGRYAIGSSMVKGLSFEDEPRLRAVVSDYERRPSVVLPAGRWSWHGEVPEGAHLQVGASPTGPADLRVTAVLRDGTRTEVLGVARSQDPAHPAWLDLGADLSEYAGRPVTIEVEARFAKPAPGVDVAWGSGVLRGRIAHRDGPPNVLLIVVDTLRHDHMSTYGYERATTPHVDALLARRGVVLEDAYSQAPWTLPSVVSFLTSRYPGELLGENMAAFGIPPSVLSLPERIRALGYDTAGFYANPALYRDNGFERGLETAFTPPADLEWFMRHADDLNNRLIPWLGAHQHRPFFLYAHYLDPHDPYDNPEIVNDRSPYYPDYPGHLTGSMIHGIYGGYHRLYRPEEDVRHITALYDSEVHYVDRFVGQLIESLEPEVLDNTLIVFTADHGEELYDHHGWKHGQTLYDEQIHVPLIFRWDRHLPPGQRLKGTVELVDLVPTVMAALGQPADPHWQGKNLLPALRGETPLPRRPAFSQHLSSGPLRAASVFDGQKLILFNRRTPFDPPDKLQEHLWRIDLERMADVELYDLDKDARETTNRAAADPESVARLAPIIHRHLDRRLPGLRVAVEGLAPGARLVARLKFENPPEDWVSYFLAPADRVRLDGRDLEVEWVGGPPGAPGRGVLVDGDLGAVTRIEATLDGEPISAAAIQVGDGQQPYDGASVSQNALRAETWPPPPTQGTVLRLWLPGGGSEDAEAPENAETRRRLKALGYL